MSKKLQTVVLTTMFVGLAAANVLLIGQNLQLRRALERYRPAALMAGQRVPAFTAEGLDGAEVNVAYAGAGPKKVLFFFTPACPYCRDQFAYWRGLLERADRERFEVIGVVDRAEDRERLREYLRQMGCDEGAGRRLRVALVSKEVRRDYKLAATPVTVVIGNDGTVEKAWAGSWNDAEAAEAGAVFGFNIPAR